MEEIIVLTFLFVLGRVGIFVSPCLLYDYLNDRSLIMPFLTLLEQSLSKSQRNMAFFQLFQNITDRIIIV